MPSSPSARLLILLTVAGGVSVMAYGIMHPTGSDPMRFLSFLAIAVLASRMKMKLPGIDGNMSMNLPFFLIASAELGVAQALAVAVAGAAAQSVRSEAPALKPVQMIFNVCTIAISVALACATQHLPAASRGLEQPGAMVLLAGVGYLLANTLPVAAIVSLTGTQAALKVWSGILTWSFPYYLLSTAVAAVVTTFDRYVDWRVPLVLLPLMFFVYRSYRMYFRRPSASAITTA